MQNSPNTNAISVHHLERYFGQGQLRKQVLFDIKLMPSRSAQMFEHVGLGKYLHDYADNLSGRQKQRVAIARALVSHPPIVLNPILDIADHIVHMEDGKLIKNSTFMLAA